MCMLTVSNALLLSSATTIVRSGGWFWLKPVAMIFMLCSAVLVELLLLKPCCMEICEIFFVMCNSSVLSSVLSLREVRWVCMMCLCSCFCLELV